MVESNNDYEFTFEFKKVFSVPEMQALATEFKSFDTDNSKSISASEWKKLCKALDIPMTEEEEM